MMGRSRRQIKPPGRFKDFEVDSHFRCLQQQHQQQQAGNTILK